MDERDLRVSMAVGAAQLAHEAPRAHRVFVFHGMLELSFADVAAMLGIGVATAHADWRRAMQRVQQACRE